MVDKRIFDFIEKYDFKVNDRVRNILKTAIDNPEILQMNEEEYRRWVERQNIGSDVSIGKKLKKMLSYVFQRKQKDEQKNKLVNCETRKGSMYGGGSGVAGAKGSVNPAGSGLVRRFKRRKANQAHKAYT